MGFLCAFAVYILFLVNVMNSEVHRALWCI